jgi:hypothetical protein
MATVSGWWEPVSETEITSRQWAEMRKAVRLATEQGKALVTAAGVSLVWHPAPDSLDAAWAEAEAALPTGWQIDRVERRDEGGWAVWADDQPVRHREYEFEYGEGDTPAAALGDLATKFGPPR